MTAARFSSAGAVLFCAAALGSFASAETRDGAPASPDALTRIEPMRQFEVGPQAAAGTRFDHLYGQGPDLIMLPELLFLPEPHTDFIFTFGPHRGLDWLRPLWARGDEDE